MQLMTNFSKKCNRNAGCSDKERNESMAKNDKMEAQKEAKLKALDDAIAHIEKQN